MHAEFYGSLSKVKKAVNKKYWGIECDLHGNNGKLYCYHTNKNSSSPTLADTIKEAKKSNSKILIDIKDNSTNTLKSLASFIKKNKLQNQIMIAFQLKEKPEESMKLMNSIAGSKLQYWGLIVGGKDDAKKFANKAKTFKNLGMTTIHLPKNGDHGYNVGTKENINKLKKAGYNVSVYTWSTFSSKEITNYIKMGVKYLMVDNIDTQKSK